jgi:hypothetical protein
MKAAPELGEHWYATEQLAEEFASRNEGLVNTSINLNSHLALVVLVSAEEQFALDSQTDEFQRQLGANEHLNEHNPTLQQLSRILHGLSGTRVIIPRYLCETTDLPQELGEFEGSGLLELKMLSAYESEKKHLQDMSTSLTTLSGDHHNNSQAVDAQNAKAHNNVKLQLSKLQKDDTLISFIESVKRKVQGRFHKIEEAAKRWGQQHGEVFEYQDLFEMKQDVLKVRIAGCCQYFLSLFKICCRRNRAVVNVEHLDKQWELYAQQNHLLSPAPRDLLAEDKKVKFQDRFIHSHDALKFKDKAKRPFKNEKASLKYKLRKQKSTKVAKGSQVSPDSGGGRRRGGGGTCQH